MPNLIQADIFFFVTTLAVLAISFFVVLLLIRLRALARTLHRLVEKLSNVTDYAGEEAHELLQDIKQSSLFRFFFPRRSRKSTPTKESARTIPRRRV